MISRPTEKRNNQLALLNWFRSLNCSEELYELFKAEPTMKTHDAICKAASFYQLLLEYGFDPADKNAVVLVFEGDLYGGLTAMLAHLTKWQILCLPLKVVQHSLFITPDFTVPVQGVSIIQADELVIDSIPAKFAVIGKFAPKYVVNKVLPDKPGQVLLLTTDRDTPVPHTPMYGEPILHASQDIKRIVVNLALRGVDQEELELQVT